MFFVAVTTAKLDKNEKQKGRDLLLENVVLNGSKYKAQ